MRSTPPLQALQRIKGSPEFLEKATEAYEAYRQQIIDAESAVHAFCEQHGKADCMTWRHRPDLEQVGDSLLCYRAHESREERAQLQQCLPRAAEKGWTNISWCCCQPIALGVGLQIGWPTRGS